MQEEHPYITDMNTYEKCIIKIVKCTGVNPGGGGGMGGYIPPTFLGGGDGLYKYPPPPPTF